MKKELDEFASICVSSNMLSEKQIPYELRKRQFINNFVIALEYWQKNNYQETPEKITDYFIKLN